MSDAFGLLWTSIPVELVMDGLTPQVAACVEMNVQGRILQVLPGGDGTGTVQRLISGEPQDYLDPRWQPGTRVAMLPDGVS